MIDGCLAWERKDTTLEFSLLEQGRLMSGARAVHTTVMSGLGLRWAEFILSCCSDGGLVLEVFHPNIPPLLVVLAVGVVLFFHFFANCFLTVPYVVGRGSGVGMIST